MDIIPEDVKNSCNLLMRLIHLAKQLMLTELEIAYLSFVFQNIQWKEFEDVDDEMTYLGIWTKVLINLTSIETIK